MFSANPIDLFSPKVLEIIISNWFISSRLTKAKEIIAVAFQANSTSLPYVGQTFASFCCLQREQRIDVELGCPIRVCETFIATVEWR